MKVTQAKRTVLKNRFWQRAKVRLGRRGYATRTASLDRVNFLNALLACSPGLPKCYSISALKRIQI